MKYFVIILCLLCGCSKTPPSTSIADSVKQDITTIQTDIKNSQLSDTEKSSLNSRLETIKAEVKNITLACESEKQILKKEKEKLELVILWLITLIIIFILYFLGKLKFK